MTAKTKPAQISFVRVGITLVSTVLCGCLIWLYTTNAGLLWLLSNTKAYQPQQIQIGKVSGNLLLGVVIDNVQWQEADKRLSLKQVDLQCQWLGLIWGQLNCHRIELEVLNFADNTVDSRANELPELTGFDNPLPLYVEHLSIAQLAIRQREQKHTVQLLRVETLLLAERQFRFAKATAVVEQHVVSLVAQLQPNGQWRHDLRLDVEGAQLGFSLQSKGRIKKAADISVKMHKPYAIQASGQWHYNRGLFVRQGKIQADNQSLSWQQQSFDVRQLTALFELAWPSLTADMSIAANHQFIQDFAADISLKVADINRWQDASVAAIELSGRVSKQPLRDYLQTILPDKWQPSASNAATFLPLTANVDVTLEQNQLILNSENIQQGDSKAQLNVGLALDGPDTMLKHISGELHSPSLRSVLDMDIADVFWQWHWQQGSAQLEHQLTTQGRVGKLAVNDLLIRDLDWQLDLAQHLNGYLTAQRVESAQQSLVEPKLTITGAMVEHQVSLRSKLAGDQHLEMGFQGQLTEQQWQWLGFKAALKSNAVQMPLTASANSLSFAPEQTLIDGFCLQLKGHGCINAQMTNAHWQVQLNLHEFSLLELFAVLNPWWQTPVVVEGVVNGKVDGSGQGRQLERFDIAMDSEQLFTAIEGSSGVLQNLTIKGNSEQQRQLAARWVNGQIRFVGAGAKGLITMPDGSVSLDLTDLAAPRAILRLANVLFQRPLDDGRQRKLFELPLLTMEAMLQQQRLSSSLDIRLKGQDGIVAKLTSDWPVDWDSKVDGEFSAAVEQFDFAKVLFPQIDEITGKLAHKGVISGQLNGPVINGSGDWQLDKLLVEELGLAIERSQLRFEHKQDSMTVTGALNNPNGTLQVNAQVDYLPTLSASFNISGNNVTLVNNAENKVVVSPTVNGTYQRNKLRLDSRIVVDQGKLNITELPQNAVTVSNDQVVKGEQIRQVRPFDYEIEVELDAGEQTKVSGFGLSSEVKGKVKVLVRADKPVVANGILRLIGGKFVAYKQVLDIEKGQLNFIGSAENPGIEFTASREIDDIKVGIIAQGTVAKPIIRLFSQPTMPDENILALLITGRSLDSLTKGEGNALANAAIGLGVDGANKIVGRIAGQLGIDNINITSKAKADSTRIDIGAQLNSRLNISYGTTIDANNNLQSGWILHYRLSPQIAFEAVGGNTVGTSITYSKRFSGK